MAFKPVRSDVGVWMADLARCESVARMIAIDAMLALGLDPSDFRIRDKLIEGISGRVNATLDLVANEDMYRHAMENMAEQLGLLR